MDTTLVRCMGPDVYPALQEAHMLQLQCSPLELHAAMRVKHVSNTKAIFKSAFSCKFWTALSILFESNRPRDMRAAGRGSGQVFSLWAAENSILTVGGRGSSLVTAITAGAAHQYQEM